MNDYDFNITFNVERRNPDGSVTAFQTNGCFRITQNMNINELNRNNSKAIFYLSPRIKVLPGDTLTADNHKFTLFKVSMICDLDNKLRAYRAESVS